MQALSGTRQIECSVQNVPFYYTTHKPEKKGGHCEKFPHFEHRIVVTFFCIPFGTKTGGDRISTCRYHQFYRLRTRDTHWLWSYGIGVYLVVSNETVSYSNKGLVSYAWHVENATKLGKFAEIS